MAKKKHKQRNNSAEHQISSTTITSENSLHGPSSMQWYSLQKSIEKAAKDISDKVKDAISQGINVIQHTLFTTLIGKINIDIYENILIEWQDRFVKGFDNGINERAIIGALMIRECFSFSDKELIDKLVSDSFLRKALGSERYFDKTTFKEAYVSFGQIIYKYYKSTNRDVISESMLPIAPNGEVSIRISQKDVIINCSQILQHIIHKNIYRFMYNALDKCYKSKRYSIDYNIRNKVDSLLQTSYNDIIFESNPTQLVHRLEAIGDLSYNILQRLKIKQGNENQLGNYFNKYYEVNNNRVYLKRISVANPFVYKKMQKL